MKTQLTSSHSLRFGIDLGGTKIELIALVGEREYWRQRVATPQGDYLGTLSAITQLVQQAEQQLGQQGSVGIGIPGALSAETGRVKNANSVCLIGHDLKGDLEYRLSRPIRLANDADCFALSEASDGAGHAAYSVFGVILGTGVGGGIVVNGQLLRGPNAIAGEWGHNPLPWRTANDGEVVTCYCGKTDCIETFLSGPGWAKRAQRGVDAQTLYTLAEKSDPAAQSAFSRYCDQLARALASVINILDPEVIVLGGGLSQMQRLYEEVPARWGAYVFSDSVRTQLRPAQWGDSSGVRGAAWLWPSLNQ